MDLRKIGPASAALRLARPGTDDWQVLVCDRSYLDAAAKQLRHEATGLVAAEVQVVRGIDGPMELALDVSRREGKILILIGLDGFSESDWRHWDALRSQLVRDASVCMIMSLHAAELMQRCAPNFASWIGGSLWELGPETGEPTPEEIADRLQGLRTWANLTDDEVVALAQQGRLPPDPEFQEWLALLRRGDLVGR